MKAMQEHFDVAVIGGALSGAATALLLRREHPDLSVVVIERAAHFDRKVGEATTEMSGCFLTKRLQLTHHLNHHHLGKHGLRFWFTGDEKTGFEECGELGALYQVRMPSFQLDREVLDEHVLEEAGQAGATVLRPAKLAAVEFAEDGASRLTVEQGGEKREITAKWVVDASGRAAVLARKFGVLKPLPEHPTNSIWARFRKVKDWDGHELFKKYPKYAKACQVSRATATNHLVGYGWWVWIIPLKGGDFSAGIVYDSRLYTPPPGEKLGDRLKAHLLSHPVGREIFGDAEYIEGDVKAYSSLPYFSEKIGGPGWQMVGDATGFMDPLYSQGLDYGGWTISAAVERIAAEHEGRKYCLDSLNQRWNQSYHGWFNALYKDKYYYLGDMELMTAAFLMDLGLYFFGPVRTVVGCLKEGFGRFPFDGPVDSRVSKFMSFYNKRLAAIARKRHAAGVYGTTNVGMRTLVKGFEPSLKARGFVWRGIKVWLRAELRSALLPRPEEKPMAEMNPVPAS